MKKNISRNPLWPDWYNGKKIDEVQFGRAFLEQWPLKCVNGTLYTLDGPVEDESEIKQRILENIEEYVTSGLSKKVTNILETIKLLAFSDPFPIEQDCIHLQNGVYHQQVGVWCPLRPRKEKRMAYVTVPKDLTHVKSKVLFGLTKRQLVCFGGALLTGGPLYFLARNYLSNSAAALLMIFAMLPGLLFALFERHGQPLEVVIQQKYYTVGIQSGSLKADSGRISDAETANSLKEKCTGANAVCTSIRREKKAEQPPKLYDLTTLQREANRLFGFTAKQTLDYAQKLYEKKLLTYPRTDSQYLTEDMGQTAQHLVSDLLGLLPFAQGLDLTPEVGRILNSKKVSDHHAIIPTSEFVKQGFTGLAESECKLMNLVCSKLLCAIAAPHEYETVTAVFSCAGNEFTAKGKTVLVPGWKEIDQRFRSTLKADGEEETENLNTLPELTEGQSYSVVSDISEHFTSPPKAYTEDTLLSAMERAGAEDMPEDKVNCSAGAREGGLGHAERKGLGTPATRAAILEKLVQMGFVQRKGKQLVPTKDGINLAVVLPESLTSPALTAEWENRLTEIAKGNADPDEFMAEIEAQVRQLVKTYSCISADKQNLFQSERIIIGKCPRCSENVYEGKKNFYCGNRSCQFVMWKNDRFFEQRKKAFTPKIAAALLKNGKAKVKGLYSEKTGKTYDATVLLADTGGKYVNYRVERKE